MRTNQLLGFALALASVTTACVAPAIDEETADTAQALARTVAPNRLVTDKDVEGDQDLTAADVQTFLLAKGSALATYREAGRSAAEIIVTQSRAEHISPVYMLARIETESGLVRSGTRANIRSATGCGCPDGVACDPSLASFALQVRCAAELMRGYFSSMEGGGATISGWRVGVPKSTLDGCFITPRNRATAAFYTYTPWVGAYAVGCGTEQWGGSSLVAVLLREFAASLGRGSACAFGDGLYCGGNGTPGDAATLYRCTDGTAASEQQCTNGCARMPAGSNDRCN